MIQINPNQTNQSATHAGCDGTLYRRDPDSSKWLFWAGRLGEWLYCSIEPNTLQLTRLKPGWQEQSPTTDRRALISQILLCDSLAEAKKFARMALECDRHGR